MISISSSFQYNINLPMSRPVRQFIIGTSDYSDRVIKWPKINRTTEDFKSLSVNVPLANNDGIFNQFYSQSYNIKQTAYLKIGFDNDLVTIFTGELYGVRYPSEGVCEFKVRDKIWEFSTRKIGDNTNAVTFAAQIPSDIAWTLCSCYGGLSDIRSTSNPDIDYESYVAWSNQYSLDTIRCSAEYKGTKLTEALQNLTNMTDSIIWVTNENKVAFARWTNPDSTDALYGRGDMKSISVDVERDTIINRMKVGFDYNTTSNAWQYLTYQDSASVNSFGLYDKQIEDKTIWFVGSAYAMNMAERMVSIRREPPKQWSIKSGLNMLPCEISDTVRMVNSFYSVTSSDIWRIIGHTHDMESGEVSILLDIATMETEGGAFYLDVSLLDGPDILY